MDGNEAAERIGAALTGQGDLDAAVADLLRMPADFPGRSRLAAGLVAAMLRAGPAPSLAAVQSLGRLVAIADLDPPEIPQWTRIRRSAEALSLLAPGDHRPGGSEAALARLATLAADSDGDPGLKPLLDLVGNGLRVERAMREDDPGALARAPADFRALLAGLPEGVAAGPMAEFLTEATGLLADREKGEEVLPAIVDLLTRAQRIAPGGAFGEVAADALADFTAMAEVRPGSGGRLTDAHLAALAEQAEGTGGDRALKHSLAALLALGVGEETDLDRVETGVGQARQAVQASGPGDPRRAFHLFGLGLALARRNELTNTAADAREAVTVLETARESAGGPQNPQWREINELLAAQRRLVGGSADFYRSGVEGLLANSWKVLIQPDLAGATAAVRTAGRDAVDVARQCLIAGDPAAALSALDAGRGLALFAATEARGIAGRLDAAGETELAGRWRSAVRTDPGKLPPDLRREVMRVLARHSPAGELLEPPSYAGLQRALRAVDADALIYLVPGAQALPGYAVFASATGAPSFMALPYLVPGTDIDLDRYLTVLAGRDLTPASNTAGLADSLDALCGWAWDAAVGPIVERYLPRLPKPEHRPYRVVLVPMGDLARVPWHAARNPEGRYAVELMAISQAVSGRMLCHSAGLPPVAATPTGLVVGDPDTGEQAPALLAARLEAYAIRQVFYPGARFVGRKPDGVAGPAGPGSAQEVRDWLTAPGPAKGGMLHLACHGFVQAGGDDPTAYLLLAGGRKLTAEELVALMATAPERAVGLVVLAACRTGQSINGYDEAYSLGTAFLAGGARSVLSTQWSVPDSATSVLMFMFHHFLRAGRLPAWAALRQAQLWMLDPDRRIPDDLPATLRAEGDLGAVVAWAAFVHWGQ
jgi:hypothetical protein